VLLVTAVLLGMGVAGTVFLNAVPSGFAILARYVPLELTGAAVLGLYTGLLVRRIEGARVREVGRGDHAAPIMHTTDSEVAQSPTIVGSNNAVHYYAAPHRHMDQNVEQFGRVLTTDIDPVPVARVTTSVETAERFAEQLTYARENARRYRAEDWPIAWGYREAGWWPAQFDATRYTVDRLRAAALQARTTSRGWPFMWLDEATAKPHVVEDRIEVIARRDHHLSPMQYPEIVMRDYWQLRQSGLFYQTTPMLEEAHIDVQSGERVLLWQVTASYVAEAVDCLGLLCTAMGITEEDVTLLVRLTGMRDRVLMVTEGYTTVKYCCVEAEARWEVTRPAEEWQANRTALAVDIAREMLMRCGWPSPPHTILQRQIEQFHADR